MRRPTAWEESRLDLVDLQQEEIAAIAAMLGPIRVGRRGRRLWRFWSSGIHHARSRMVRFTVVDNDRAEALWLVYGSDPRLVDGIRNTDGSPSCKFVEAYTHWIDCPYDEIAPVIHWARHALPRHQFDWGGGSDRWNLWFKTAAAMAAFEERWPDHALAPAPAPVDSVDRLIYVRRVAKEARDTRAAA